MLVFIAVPVVIFIQFKHADQEKNELLLRNAQEQGYLVARALTPLLEKFDGKAANEISVKVQEFSAGRSNIKLLYRPISAESLDNFYYVAAAPSVSAEYLREELQALLREGVTGKLGETCDGYLPQTARYTNPAGREELTTSIIPIHVKSGCWVLIISQAAAEYLTSSLGRPYWNTAEVHFAGAIYLFMAVIVIWLFFDAGGNLRRFRGGVRALGDGATREASFAKLNRIPEFHQVAQELDGLVNSLRSSERIIRQAAEENAHALKGPLAVISQAMEPVRRSVPADDERGQRAIQLIEQSASRLDLLVSAARRMDEIVAELIDPPRRRIDLSTLVKDVVSALAEAVPDGGPSLACEIADGVQVLANEDHIETILENVLENARHFSPPERPIVVRLAAAGQEARLTVEDGGPGVPPDDIERIFERYYSRHDETPPDGPEPAYRTNSGPHFGIGLWIVRRNVEAFGGTVRAENVPGSGLRVVVSLPLAS